MSARRTLARLGAASTAAGALAVGLAAPASAHVTVTPSETAAGAYTVLTFSVGHGCEGSPTTKIAIEIPEGINAVTPTRNDYYDVTKQPAKLDPPVTDDYGNRLTERVATVTYTATTALPDGFRDTFELQVQIPEDAEGEELTFPAIQTCRRGETAWTQIPAAGQSEDDLESPAPAFAVTAAEDDGHGDGHGDGAEEDAAEGTADAAEPVAGTASSDTRASEDSASDDSDDGNGLAVAGLVAGVGGLLLGGAALARGRRTA